jgi:hypothetical protein
VAIGRILLAISIFSVGSCIFHDTDIVQSTVHKLESVTKPARIKVLPSEGDSPLAELVYAPACTSREGTRAQEWQVKFDTPFDQHTATVSFQDGAAAYKIRIGAREFSVNELDALPTHPTITGFCRDAAEATVRASAQLQSQIRSWLTAVSPDCEFRFQNGWHCQLRGTEPERALSEISAWENQLIRQGSRQPYALMRKLAVTSTLAKQLTGRLSDQEIAGFCGIIKHSRGEELPAIMAPGAPWISAFCASGRDRDLIGKIGLNMASRELDQLITLLDKQTRTGNIRIQLPQTEASGRFVRLTLKPQKDVQMRLAGDSRGRSVCWHPLFTDDDLARGFFATRLGMINTYSAVTCSAQATEEDEKKLMTNLAEMVLSESDFFVVNGTVKTIRLLSGTYTYGVEALPQNPLDWPRQKTTRASHGDLSWSGKRPSGHIMTW